MKKNKIKICIISFIIIIAIILTAYISNKNNLKEHKENNIENPYTTIDKNNEISYNNTSTVDELKKDTGASGDDNIYEIQTEYDGKKVLNVKANIQIQTAFAGMIKHEKPEKENIEKIYNENSPKNAGIWVEEQSREKIKDSINELTKSKYDIDENGYIKISQKIGENQYDKIIEKAIKSDNQYILSISGEYYQIDALTGQVQIQLFEEMDPYQPYSYIQDEKRMIIFITENKKEKLSKNEIAKSIFEVLGIL